MPAGRLCHDGLLACVCPRLVCIPKMGGGQVWLLRMEWSGFRHLGPFRFWGRDLKFVSFLGRDVVAATAWVVRA